MTKQKGTLFRFRISERKIREIEKYFAYDIEARKVAELTNLNRKTVNNYYKEIRSPQLSRSYNNVQWRSRVR